MLDILAESILQQYYFADARVRAAEAIALLLVHMAVMTGLAARQRAQIAVYLPSADDDRPTDSRTATLFFPALSHQSAWSGCRRVPSSHVDR